MLCLWLLANQSSDETVNHTHDVSQVVVSMINTYNFRWRNGFEARVAASERGAEERHSSLLTLLGFFAGLSPRMGISSGPDGEIRVAGIPIPGRVVIADHARKKNGRFARREWEKAKRNWPREGKFSRCIPTTRKRFVTSKVERR